MSEELDYELIEGGHVPIKAWTKGVSVEEAAKVQLRYASMLPIVFKHIAVMPDVHFGVGCTVGTVLPTVRAIVPSTVGVDLGCGMIAVRTSLTSHQISENGQDLFDAIVKAVPHGGGKKEEGNWVRLPEKVRTVYQDELHQGLRDIIEKHGKVSAKNVQNQLGTLGGGNHFVEVCYDEEDRIWFMLHSGSRGIGNKIGQYFINLAREDMLRQNKRAPNHELSYFEEGAEHFQDYVEAVTWAQNYARLNRELMMDAVVTAVLKTIPVKINLTDEAVNCHHNYVQKEMHFGEEVYVTRKGAVSARLGELGIIPGSMGTRSYIVRGKGNPESFQSCSHGAGRVMARGEAKRTITLEQHREDTKDVVCRKDRDIIDESPRAYKPIEAVMNAQKSLVDVVHELRQIVCVKG